MNAFDATFSVPVPPSGYSVNRVAFQQWQAFTSSGQLLGTFSMQKYAVNRCFRDQAGLKS